MNNKEYWLCLFGEDWVSGASVFGHNLISCTKEELEHVAPEKLAVRYIRDGMGDDIGSLEEFENEYGPAIGFWVLGEDEQRVATILYECGTEINNDSEHIAVGHVYKQFLSKIAKKILWIKPIEWRLTCINHEIRERAKNEI